MLRETNSAAETRALGEEFSGSLRPGDVVVLEGELGAGKSELARGIARGLGVRETVTSPSFTILNVYESGRCPLYHFDWYRLERRRNCRGGMGGTLPGGCAGKHDPDYVGRNRGGKPENKHTAGRI